MLLLLPPSETKRDGGADDRALDVSSLGFPELAPQRRTALAALARLSRSVSASMAGLGLGPNQRAEVDRNRAIRSAPVMEVLDRYTGVLYDGVDVASLRPAARAFAGRHVAVHSALFGLLRADDRIPVYRLSHDSRLPGVSLRALWRAPIGAALGAQAGLTIDLRSESYATLGPAPEAAWRVRVVAEDASGRRLALSHFNKAAKGEFVRAVLDSEIDHATVESLLEWALDGGIQLERTAPSELDLVV
ncbi:MAG: peroxide stress protein YaaA [Rhodoglobus sp.]